MLLDDVRQIVRAVDASGEATLVADHVSLLAAGVIDSLAMIELIAAIEKTFGIQLSDNELTPENFESVIAIRDLVQRKQSERR